MRLEYGRNPLNTTKEVNMTMRATRFIALSLVWVASTCQAANSKASPTASPGVAPATTHCALPETPAAVRSEDVPASAEDILLAHDRSSLQKLFGSPTILYQCPNGNLKCGTACCTSDEQCCLNTRNATWYCSKKCD